MTQNQPLTVTCPDNRTVLVTRRFAAPPAIVWRHFTDPHLLPRWMLGPPGWAMPVCEMDLRPGGAFRWRWRAVEGSAEFGFSGTFQEVVPNRLLRHSEVFDAGGMGGDMGSGSQVTLTFTEVRDGTEVATRITYASAEDCAAAVSTGMTGGMEASYTGLDTILAAS